MGRIVIAMFKPKPGQERELLEVIGDRLPLLRKLGLATDRPNITMRSREGVILDISEWVSDEAIDTAHQTPEVRALWDRFAACSDYVSFDKLRESGEYFPNFDALN